MTPLTKETSPGYQVEYSEAIKRQVRIETAAVGEIRTVEMAEEIIQADAATVVLMGRKLLEDSRYAMRAAAAAERWDLIPLPYQRSLKRKFAPAEFIPEL